MSEVTLLQRNPDRGANLDPRSDFYGWLFFRHPDGQWVTLRKLKNWEIMQAENQRDEGIVLDSGHNIISRSNGVRCG